MAGNENENNLDLEAAFLSRLLASCQVWPNGTVIETRVRVDSFKGVEILIHPKEHPPAHFHVKYNGKEASYSIEDCTLIAGGLSDNKDKIVKYWFDRKKQRLIDTWNSTRPSDCIVGKFEPEVGE